MRHATTREEEPSLWSLVDCAMREPVFIERGTEQAGVLLSASQYERLCTAANLDLQRFCDAVPGRALASGLTEARLQQLLTRA